MTVSKVLVVECCVVEYASVIPDGDVVLILPAEANLQIVVLNKEFQEPIEQTFGFSTSDAVDVADVRADGEDGLPSCDGVGACRRRLVSFKQSLYGLWQSHHSRTTGWTAFRTLPTFSGEPRGLS